MNDGQMELNITGKLFIGKKLMGGLKKNFKKCLNGRLQGKYYM